MDEAGCKARVAASNQQGSFLVRVSRGTRGAFVFCINLGNGRVQEDLAKPDGPGGMVALFFANGKTKATPSFADLPSLVAYCQTHWISPREGITFKLGAAAPPLQTINAVYADATLPSASDAVYACVYGEIDSLLLEFYNRVVVTVHEIYEPSGGGGSGDDKNNPLAALQFMPTLPLADAIKAAEKHCGSLTFLLDDAHEFAVANVARLATAGVSDEDAKTIFIYTKDSDLYRKMNAALGGYGDEADPRANLVHYLPYVRLLKDSLALLPKVNRIVYRGVNLAHTILLNGAQVGDTITWWGFTSTTMDPRVLRAKEFCDAIVSVTDGMVSNVQTQSRLYGNVEPEKKTIFQIDACSGANIKQFSDVSHEDEVLLLPGSRFVVNAIALWRHGITEVRLTQIDDDDDNGVGSPAASADESAFNDADDYMALDPNVDSHYDVVNVGSELQQDTAVYSTCVELDDAANAVHSSLA